MKKLATVAVAVVMTAVSGFSVADDLSDGSAVQIKVSNIQRVAPKKHEGFKWGETKSQRRVETSSNSSTIDSVEHSKILIANSIQPALSSYETNGFRWGIRNHHETQGFRWGIRNHHETQGFRWGIRNHHETQGFRWGIR
jgi:hypothetical protein